ncbi:MAG: cell wall anchor protein [Muribaculaceae bacterium]
MIVNLRIKLMCLAAIVMWLPVTAGNVIVKASLDSATLVMGRQTALHIEISQDKNAHGFFVNENADTLTSKVEIAFKTEGDTTDIDNGRIQIKRDFMLQSFDSGMYVLPPLQYVVGSDTFLTPHLSLKVLPVNVDSLKTVHDYKPVEDVPFKFFDWVPDVISDYWWVYLIVLLIIAAALFVYFKWIRHGEIPLLPKKKRLPPYEEAILCLEQLKEKKLWQAGQEKVYFTELTDILRVYIARRFGVNACEMTSSQIIDELRNVEEARDVNSQLYSILEISDFVKFASMKPLPDDNETAYQRAVNYVNETKPVELPDEKAEGDKTEGDETDNASEQEVKK